MLQHFLRRQVSDNKAYATMFAPLRSEVVYSPVAFYDFILKHRSEYPMLQEKDMEVLKSWAQKGTWGGGHAYFERALTSHYFGNKVIAECVNFFEEKEESHEIL